jgi:Putative peptidoglycan binding domain
VTAKARVRVPARARRRAGLVAAPIALAGAHRGHPAVRPAATGSAMVVRTDLASMIQVSGALGFAGSSTIVNQRPGTAYTALPAPGATIRRGQALYEVDGTPVTLFYGTRPPWRALYAGVVPGPDVAQLDRNLVALGYGAGLTVSDDFTAATAGAVARWQAVRGLPVTGTVPLG